MRRTFPPATRSSSRVLALAVVLGAPLALRAQTAEPRPGESVATSTLAPTGPHGVGRRLVAWTDSSRHDPVDTTRRREVVAWVWYPAAAPPAAAPAEPALPGEWGVLRREAMRAKLGERLAAGHDALRVHARTVA